MNKLLKTALIALTLLVIPMNVWAQQPQFNNNQSIIEFDITEIAVFDERFFFMHNLLNDSRFDIINSEKDGVFIISANEAFESLDLADVFANFRAEKAAQFAQMDKEEASALAIAYKAELPSNVVASLMMDYYIRSRQNNTCANADPFCTDNGLYEFPAGVNAGSGESGPYYDCLSTTPNPAWYYMRILNPGNIDIYMYSTPSVDIDFCCWGPFTDPTSPCPNGLTSNKVVSCSYAAAHTEHCLIPSSAQTGQYYILVITNYSNQQTNISFSKVAGTGTTDCGILPPLVENDGPYCVGETIHLTANGQAGATYSWSGPAGFTSNQQNPTRPNCTLNMAGTYTCTIAVGSQTNSAETVVVIHPQPTANFTFTTVCQGNPTQFTSTSTTDPAGQQITAYQWNFGDGQTSTQQNPTHQYANAGTYQVTLTVSCGNGLCTDTETQTVTVYTVPMANAGPDQTIGYGGTATLSGSGGAGTFNFHWEPANMVTNPNAQSTQTVALTHDQTYTLTVTNPQGNCTSSDQVTIHISGSAMTVTANATPSSICSGSSTQLQANAGGGTGNFTYSWTPTTGLSNPNIYNPIANPTQTTTYTCHVSDGQTSQNVSATVTVHHAGFSEETHYICPNELYEWHGQNYSDEGDYEFLTETQYGCDSTITLHLRHYPTYDETLITAAICTGESYTFYGNTYNSSTQTSYTDHTIHGCDSIIRLELTVWPENELTVREVSLCPEQLPYNFYGENYYSNADVIVLDTDIHGCDSAVRLMLSVSDYYMPETQTAYVCTLPYLWEIRDANNTLITTKTLNEAGHYCDTLPTSACEGIFQLDLNYQPVPDVIVDDVISCDSYTWYMTGQTYTQSDDYYHSTSLYPYPCEQVYQLHLTINTQSLLDDAYVSDSCDMVRVSWFNQDTVFYENTTYKFTGLTDEGCYREQTYHIENMKYTPNPRKIQCEDLSAVVFGAPDGDADTIAVVTNTEFFSFQYSFNIEETKRECVWESCNWSISKPSWTIECSPAPMLSANGKYYSQCTVFVGDREEDYVVLTATANNGCGSEQRKFYLKSSFLDVEENELAPANVNIMPNPNNGQMHIDFENMEGRTTVKVFDMTGNQIDAFETQVSANRYRYDYNMKPNAEGIYFFVIANDHRAITKKVVLMH